jgi:Ca2+/Na+ antiporter
LFNIIPTGFLDSFPIVLTVFLGSIILIVLATRVGVYSAVSILAKTFNWRQDTVGKLLGYVTSTPEFVTTIYLASAGLYVSALYNIVSSNIMNIILVLSVLLFVFKKISKSFLKNVPYFTLGLTLILPTILIIFTNHVNYLGYVAAGLIVFYLLYLFYTKKKKHDTLAPVEYHPIVKVKPNINHIISRTIVALTLLTVGITVIVISGEMFTASSQILITQYDAPELLIGAITGIATSLPELTTFYLSAKLNKNQPEAAHEEITHNLLASNASNIYLGYTAAMLFILLL